MWGNGIPDFGVRWFARSQGAVSNSKNRGWGVGIACGGLLGVIGLIVVACMQPASSVPPGMEAARCPRRNAVQNSPRGADSFECWQCSYLARSQPGKKAINA
jgi:hypothetical protein